MTKLDGGVTCAHPFESDGDHFTVLERTTSLCVPALRRARLQMAPQGGGAAD